MAIHNLLSKHVIYSDAFLNGRGRGTYGNISSVGHWPVAETKLLINVLELLADYNLLQI